MGKIRQWQNHKGRIIDSVNGYDIIQCAICSFKHAVPIPILKEVENFYRKDFYGKEYPLYLKRHREDLKWWNLAYSDRYETFEKIMSPGRRRILDIGSGPGFFLLRGKERGWKVFGIEPSLQAVEHSRALGLNVRNDFFTARTAKYLGKFDVVHLSEVLEHIPNPIELLKLARGLLNPGGLICVISPNDYNPFQHALRVVCRYKPWWVDPPEHVNYFDFNSLKNLLSRSGFKVILKETSFPMDIFLLMGDNYVGNEALGRKCHKKRMVFEKKLALAGLNQIKRQLYQAFAAVGLGREVMLIGMKQ